MRQGIRSVVCLEKLPQSEGAYKKFFVGIGEGKGGGGLSKRIVQELIHIRVARWQYSVMTLLCHLLSK
jgi:hypothetical protein